MTDTSPSAALIARIHAAADELAELYATPPKPEPAELDTPARRGRIAVVATTVDGARDVALAAGIDLREVIPYTLRNEHTTQGAILRGAVVAPDFAVLLANGNAYAYDTLARLRRDLAKARLRL